jgi:hypothetical protein
MGDKKKVPSKITSTKFGAAMLAAWMPMINEMGELGLSPITLALFIAPMCVYIIVEGYLDGLRIKHDRGGPTE